MFTFTESSPRKAQGSGITCKKMITMMQEEIYGRLPWATSDLPKLPVSMLEISQRLHKQSIPQANPINVGITKEHIRPQSRVSTNAERIRLTAQTMLFSLLRHGVVEKGVPIEIVDLVRRWSCHTRSCHCFVVSIAAICGEEHGKAHTYTGAYEQQTPHAEQ
jgi:hypothetical protein